MITTNGCPNDAQIKEHLLKYENSDFLVPFEGSNTVKEIDISENLIRIAIVFGFPIDTISEELANNLKEHFKSFTKIPVEFDLSWKIVRHVAQKNIKGISSIKNIIAVHAAKGGVGKSTISSKLALALAYQGAKVGLLDADIYGPSIPKLFSLSGNPETMDGKKFEPFVCKGIEIISVGFLVEEDTAMIWRGPMATAALTQLINDTNWSNLDYLIVDMPPGTGDIPLTLAQKIPTTGVLLVTTPQNLSITDVRRSIALFSRMDIAVLGMVENMKGHVCPHCLKSSTLFEGDQAQQLAKAKDVKLLSSIPLSSDLASLGGSTQIDFDPQNENDKLFTHLALTTTALVSLRGKDYASKFPKIKVGNAS